jgi:HSP20 family molecular chaperone IbpA
VVDQVPIPGPMDANKLVREYKEGVLTIRIPKQAFIQTV